MSGFEIAGVVLGAIPLVVSGLEQWEKIATVRSYWRNLRAESRHCRRNLEMYKVFYKVNLKELLIPIVDETGDVTKLVNDPNCDLWKDERLSLRLQQRLQDSYDVYMGIVNDMNEDVNELQRLIYAENHEVEVHIQSLDDTQHEQTSSTNESWLGYFQFQHFRLKFSTNAPRRNEIFTRLEKHNQRLEKLLSGSDRMASLEKRSSIVPTESSAGLERLFNKARSKANSLFRALEEAWQCTCQSRHLASLRLEHRFEQDICFEIILMFNCPSLYTDLAAVSWSWKELKCGQIAGCSISQHSLLSPPSRQLSSASRYPRSTSIVSRNPVERSTNLNPRQRVPDIQLNVFKGTNIKLCRRLGDEDCGECMGILSHGSEIFHLHPFSEKAPRLNSKGLSLEEALSFDYPGNLSRRDRYHIALSISSSVAQLQPTQWLSSGLTKRNIMFFPYLDEERGISFRAPFVRQGFSPQDDLASERIDKRNNFHSLGVLLLELCFGQRLEDQVRYTLLSDERGNEQQQQRELGLAAALEWAKQVNDEAGPDYSSAVNWCFIGRKPTDRSWRTGMIDNVIKPLELCQIKQVV